MAKKKKTKCEKNGYHNWVVDCINGLAPNESLDLTCDDCGKQASAEVTNIHEVE